MKTASSALLNLLASKLFIMADLFTIILVDGTTVYYTNYEVDLIFGGNTFVSSDIIIKRGTLKAVVGVQVGTLEIQIGAQINNTLNGVPWIQAVHNGALDNARIILERVFMPPSSIINPQPTDTSAGSVPLFNGRVSDSDAGRNSALIKLSSDLELLNIKMPRNLYQPGCINTLYDTGCTLLKSTFANTGLITAVSSFTIFTTDITSRPDGYFNNGVVLFTSGVNAGVRRTITSHIGGVITITIPATAHLTAGDTLTLYPGCDKTQATCHSKFSNDTNFRGFPYIPTPETAL